MVVMMHSVLGVESAAGQTGFMHAVVMFAKPFRMPDFFLISGLVPGLVIDRDWRTYLDRKVVHFAYFYVLWVTIQFGFKAPGSPPSRAGADVGILYLESFIEPFGTLWFIYLLPIFFVVIKLTRSVPVDSGLARSPPRSRCAHVMTGWTVIDEFCCAIRLHSTPAISLQITSSHWRIARGRIRPWRSADLQHGRIVNGGLVALGYSEWPMISLMLGLAGACAIITIGHAARADAIGSTSLRYCGEHSIVIYLAFFLPMASTRTLLLKTGIIPDIGTVSLIVTVVGVAGSLLIWRVALGHTPISCSSGRTRSGSRRRKPVRAAGGGVAAIARVTRLCAR